MLQKIKAKAKSVTMGNRILFPSMKIEIIGENEDTYTIRFNLHYKDAELCALRNEGIQVKKDYGVLTDTIKKEFIEICQS